MYSQERCRSRRAVRLVGLGIVCILALSPPLMAADQSGVAWQIRRLKTEIGSLRLFTMLDLSGQQKARLLPIVQKAVAAQAAQEQSLADLAPEMLEAYADFRNEAQKSADISDEVAERAEDCHRLEKELRTGFQSELAELESEVRAVLTPRQWSLATSYSPRGGGNGGPRNGPNGRRSPARGGARRGQRGGKQGNGQSGWSTISHFLLCQTIMPLLDPLAPAVETLPLDRPETRAMMGRIQDLESDIRLLNLINGLNLSADQMQKLVALAQRAREDGRGGMATGGSLKAERDLLLQAKKDLLAHGEISNATRRQLRRAAGNQGPPPPGGGRMARSTPAAEHLAGEVEAFLTDEQRQVLSQHKPCLIPPKSQREPVRAGQVADSSRFAGFIEHLRRGPEDMIENRVGQFVTGEEQKMGERTPEQRQARIDQLVALIRKARAMSDTEFAIRKDELGAQADPGYSRRRGRDDRDPVRAAIEDYLLDERIVPLLNKRLDGTM